jgi:ADP-ribose pyrophosphatase YjhB (NUDIX family)
MAGLEPEFELKTPPGDDRERRVCATCGFVDYVNPRIVAGAVVESADGQILMCKRAIEPRKGFWTLPAGFMEQGESVADAARREAREEA